MSFRFMRKDNTIRTIRNGEFIMAYMHIPREYLSRCGAELNSIPRCLKDLLYDERALTIVCSLRQSSMYMPIWSGRTWDIKRRRWKSFQGMHLNGAMPMQHQCGLMVWRN